MKVTLVRHAAPSASSAVDPTQWPLSLDGRRDAQELRHRLTSHEGLWIASHELKALETLNCLSPTKRGLILQDTRFDEVRRDEPFDDDFRPRRRAWVEGRLDVRHSGWETPSKAASRFDEAVRAYATRADRLVIGSHGMVITAWLSLIGRVQPGVAAGRFWEALAFPDLLVVDLQ